MQRPLSLRLHFSAAAVYTFETLLTHQRQGRVLSLRVEREAAAQFTTFEAAPHPAIKPMLRRLRLVSLTFAVFAWFWCRRVRKIDGSWGL